MILNVANSRPPDHDAALDYLRATITVLVVAHHAAAAYTTAVKLHLGRYPTFTAVVRDPAGARAFDCLMNFNDVFFMALMFFLSGLCAGPSLRRRGPGGYVRSRFRRLAVPFLLGSAVLMPAAYYPLFLDVPNAPAFPQYLVDYYARGGWPCGPLWFLWVLWLFSLPFAGLAKLTGGPRTAPPAPAAAPLHPGMALAGWIVFTAFLCWTMAQWFNPQAWYRLGGPFWWQAARGPFYFAYYGLGIWFGQRALESGPWRHDGHCTRLWPCWALLAGAAYGALRLAPRQLKEWTESGPLGPAAAPVVHWLLFAASCACSGLALLTFFRACVTRRAAWLDSLAAHAYVIYIVHYVFITWVGYALLPLPASAGTKFALVFGATLAGSWGLAAGSTAMLGRIRRTRGFDGKKAA